MEIEFNVLDRKDLIRACKLVDEDGWFTSLEEKSNEELQKKIYDNLNPNGNRVREQYIEAMKLFDLEYSYSMSDEDLKEKLFENNCEMIQDRIKEMSDDEKKDLTDQVEEDMNKEELEKIKNMNDKIEKVAGPATSAKMAGGIVLNGGAMLAGSNLGVCVLLTSGLSSISSVVGVTFPFAAYTGAAALGGQIIAVAGAVSNPIFWIPAAAIATGAGYHAYKESQKRQYAYLAGINYLIESKKKLQQVS
jgi:uncharacterized protein YaaW (UPF0174 family)